MQKVTLTPLNWSQAFGINDMTQFNLEGGNYSIATMSFVSSPLLLALSAHLNHADKSY
jgi:hypothetical protein